MKIYKDKVRTKTPSYDPFNSPIRENLASIIRTKDGTSYSVSYEGPRLLKLVISSDQYFKICTKDLSFLEETVSELGHTLKDVNVTVESDIESFHDDADFRAVASIHLKSKPVNQMPYGIFTFRADSYGRINIKTHKTTKSDVILIENKNLKNIVKEFFENKEVTGRKHKKGVLCYGPPGCHAKDELIMLYDGSFKKSQDIVVGDLLMGPDSKSREVLKLISGQDRMVRIIPTKGDSFVVNYNHIMHLTPSGDSPMKCPLNVSVKNLMEKTTKCAQERYKLTRSSGIDFPEKDLMINPYLFGFWLGDGSCDSFLFHTADNEIKEYLNNFCIDNDAEFETCVERANNFGSYKVKKIEGRTNPYIQELKRLNVFKNKHIPDVYLKNSREVRLELLAGLIDSDGHLKYSNGFEFSTIYENFADQVLFLCRSLGFAAYMTKEYKTCQTGNGCDSYRISISGDLDLVPTKIARKKAPKRRQIKSVLRTGFTMEEMGVDDFYGFTVDSDHLYLDRYFNIQHNCGKSSEIMQLFDLCEEFKMRVFLIDADSDIGQLEQIRHLLQDDNNIFVLEEMTERLRTKSLETLLTFLDGETSWNNSVTIATTNYPEDFPANLVDRPGRFDTFIEYGPPDKEQIIKLGEAFGFDEASVSCLAGQSLSYDYVSYILSLTKKTGLSVKETRDNEEQKRKRLSSTFKGKMGI